MSQETVKTYMLSNSDIMVPMGRKDFYAEQIQAYQDHGRPTRAVEVINIFMFNESWELIVQKRSKTKAHNAWLLDKSIWWHVQWEDSVDYTAMVETVQELQVPSLVLRDAFDFKKTYHVLKNYLDTVAIMRCIDRKIHYPQKVLEWKEVVIANQTSIFLGLYGGRVKNVDREASGILFYDFDDLLEEMDKYPDLFTQDLHMYCEYYKDDLRMFIDQIKNKFE